MKIKYLEISEIDPFPTRITPKIFVLVECFNKINISERGSRKRISIISKRKLEVDCPSLDNVVSEYSLRIYKQILAPLGFQPF